MSLPPAGLPVPGTLGLHVEQLRLVRSPHLDAARLGRELRVQEPGLHWRSDASVTTSLPWVVLLRVAFPAHGPTTRSQVGFMVGSPWSCTLAQLALLGLADWDPQASDAPLSWRRALGPSLLTRTRRGRDLEVREWRLTPGPATAGGQEIAAGSARLVCCLSGARGEQWTAMVELHALPLGELLQQAVARFER